MSTQLDLTRAHLRNAILKEVESALWRRPGSTFAEVRSLVDAIGLAMDDGTPRVMHQLADRIDNGVISVRLQNAITRYHPEFKHLQEQWHNAALAALQAAGLSEATAAMALGTYFKAADSDYCTYDLAIETLTNRIPAALQAGEPWTAVYIRHLEPLKHYNSRVTRQQEAFRTEPLGHQ